MQKMPKRAVREPKSKMRENLCLIYIYSTRWSRLERERRNDVVVGARQTGLFNGGSMVLFYSKTMCYFLRLFDDGCDVDVNLDVNAWSDRKRNLAVSMLGFDFLIKLFYVEILLRRFNNNEQKNWLVQWRFSRLF